MNIIWERIKDSLKLLGEDSSTSLDYAVGNIIGIVSAMEAFGFRFKDAWPHIIKCLPDNVRVSAIPACWLNLDDIWTLPFNSLVKFPDMLEMLPDEMLQESNKDLADGLTCRDVLLDKYLYVMSILQRETDRAFAGWNSDMNGDPAYMPKLVHSFRNFYQSGDQYVAEWSVSDKRKEHREAYNFHGQNTSQWLYAGCLLVQDGRVSIHT